MRNLYRYFFGSSIRDKLPHLHLSLTEEFDSSSVDDDVRLILLAGLVRDPHEARKLLEAHNAASAPELLKLLPKRRPDYTGKLRRWLQSIEGSYNINPYLEEHQEARRLYG